MKLVQPMERLAHSQGLGFLCWSAEFNLTAYVRHMIAEALNGSQTPSS
jgi:hypothetical protein